MMEIRNILLKKILLTMLGAFVLMILVANLFVYPSFKQVLLDDTEREAIMLANHLSAMIISESSPLNKSYIDDNRYLINQFIAEFRLHKLKIFTASGATIFSTDAQDIGVKNENDYFHINVAGGNVYTKHVKKNTLSLENQPVDIDVVEIYVPVIRNGTFLGALEIYYDISDQMAIVYDGILLSNILSVGSSLSFLVICLLVARKLDSNIIEMRNAREFLKMTNLDLKDEITNRIRAEKEKEGLISELESALLKLKVLKGLVPICSFCKNIRNDAGFWEKMEKYIEQHSDAEFSHGLCPDCAAKHYPELRLDEDDETFLKKSDDAKDQKEDNAPGKQ